MALKKCKECGGQVSSKAKACPSCGAPVVQGISTPSGCLIIIIAVVVILATMKEDKKTEDPPMQPEARRPSENPRQKATTGVTADEVATAAAPAHDSVQMGDDARVVLAGESLVYLCVSEEALSRFTQLAIAKDLLGMGEMEASGVVFAVPSGTKVKAIDPGVLRSEVRVMEGSHFGQSGFVPAEWVTKR